MCPICVLFGVAISECVNVLHLNFFVAIANTSWPQTLAVVTAYSCPGVPVTYYEKWHIFMACSVYCRVSCGNIYQLSVPIT